MKHAISERVRDVLKAREMKPRHLVELLDVSPIRVKNILAGRVKELLPDELSVMKSSLGLNEDWFLTGEGPMFLEKSAPAEPSPENDESGLLAVPAFLRREESPSPSFQADGVLMGRIFDAVINVYKEANARISGRDAVELSAKIHNDILAALGAQSDLPEQMAALKMSIQQLKKELLKPADQAENKRSA